MGWRYLLFELNGDGTEILVHTELPLKNPTLTRCLSVPHQITGDLTVPTSDLIREDGQPLVRRWKSAIMAEDPNGNIWVGGLLADYDIDGPTMSLDVAGFTAYPAEQAYDGPELNLVQVDPLDAVRTVWGWLQGQPGGNLGLELDATTSPVRIGTENKDVDFETGAGELVNFTAGSVMINAWSTDNLGGKMDEWATATPFDHIEDHSWGSDDTVEHRLRLGYPTLGHRRENLRFVLGENVFKIPRERLAGDDVVTTVIVYGAGEGRDRIRGVASVSPSSSLRRARTVTDKKITSVVEATQRAQLELARYQEDRPGAEITELVIQNKDHAPFGSYDVGDEILYSGDHDWGDVEVWVKILKLTIRPEQSDDVVATVIRTDKIKQ